MRRIIETVRDRLALVPYRHADRGFTLIELLVVVIIIGILAAIAIPVYIGVQNNAKESAVKSDLGNLKTAEVANYTNTNSYATTSEFSAKLKSLGYTQSDAANYTTTPTFTLGTGSNAGGFCLQARASTQTWFAVSDSVSLTKGTCSGTGALVPTP